MNPLTQFADQQKWEIDIPIMWEKRIRCISGIPPLGFCYLGGQGYFIDPDNPNQKFYVEGEIVEIYKRANGYAYLRDPLTNFYSAGGHIYKVPIKESVLLENGTSPITVELARSVTIRNWKISDFWDKDGKPSAIDISKCKDVVCHDIKIGKSFETVPGRGYGINLTNCDDFSIADVVVTGCRHANIFFGSRNGLIDRLVAIGCLGDGIDFAHGAGEQTITYLDCDSGNTNGAVGNKYKRGSRNITIISHKGCKDLLLYGNTINTEVRHSLFSGALRCHANQAGREMSAIVEINQFQKGYLFENNPNPDIHLVGE